VAGIRPHDLSLAPMPGHKDSVLAGRVILIEPLGSRVDVHVELSPSRRCVMSAPPDVQASIGDEVRMYVNPNKVHLFEDDDSGRRIAPDAAGC
jgi:ABC-type sugar transport system ATPase subunit